jgi:hypothetical protein
VADPPTLLRLRAEMKVPGLAWLQFEVMPVPEGTLLVQTAFFEPRGLPGLLYWYAFYPAHMFIFSNLCARLAERAESFSRALPTQQGRAELGDGRS